MLWCFRMQPALELGRITEEIVLPLLQVKRPKLTMGLEHDSFCVADIEWLLNQSLSVCFCAYRHIGMRELMCINIYLHIHMLIYTIYMHVYIPHAYMYTSMCAHMYVVVYWYTYLCVQRVYQLDVTYVSLWNLTVALLWWWPSGHCPPLMFG